MLSFGTSHQTPEQVIPGLDNQTASQIGVHGLRFMADVSLAAFIGRVEQALPHFLNEGGVCQQLTGVLGDMRNTGDRWRDLLASQ